MAGSYAALGGDSGRFRFDLIENMGDAYEACEECWYMIEYLTKGDPKLKAAALAHARRMVARPPLKADTDRDPIWQQADEAYRRHTTGARP